MKIGVLSLGGSIFLLSASIGATGSGYRTIEGIGCHLNNNTCYVYISGDPVGPVNCRSTSIRRDKETTNSGKELYSTLLAAAMAEKRVGFNISNECYGSYPTFNYVDVMIN